MIHPRIRECACASCTAAMEETDSGERGLTQEQVHLHRKKYGGNEQAPGRKKENTIPHCIRRAFFNPFTVILFLLAIILFLTDILMPEQYGQGLSSVVIISLMLVLSGVIRLFQELRAKRVADRLTNLVQTTVSVCRDGVWQEVCSDELVVGDLVHMEAGDRVPADIRLTDATDLFVSQSVITGESRILEKTSLPLTESPTKISDYSNTVFQGTTVTGGWGTGVVLAVGADTVYGNFSAEPSSRKEEFDRGAASIAWVLIKFMVILVPVVFLASGLTKGNWLEAFLFALSVAVGLTPELLPMVVNACLAKGSFSVGQKQTVVKNINAMQSLGSMDLLCVDKTGTLTGDTVTLEYFMDVLGNESGTVLDYAFLNSYYHSGVKNHLDTAILKCREMPGMEEHFETLSKSSVLLDEQPFDYTHKLVGILLKGETENLHIIKGNVEQVVSRCRFVQFQGEVIPIQGHSAEDAHAIVDEMTEDGMKVLAVACRRTSASVLNGQESDFVLLGYLGFFDAPKKSAAEAIERLKKLKVDVRVLTGDDRKTAVSICSRLGVETGHVLTGAELERISENELPLRIEQTTIFAELTPKQKAQIVELLQQGGHSVGFLGDGMNDLTAELAANVGISVDTAAEAVKESADVILLKKDLNVLEQGILEGRRAFANMAKYIKITASSNFGNICAVVVASVLLPFFPMTSLQLLLLNLLYDTLCLILPWDNVDAEQLEHPIHWTGEHLGRFMCRFGPISSVFDVLTFVFLYFLLCPALCGGSFAQLDPSGQAAFISLFQTGWFLESMWTQVLILHLLRTNKIPFLQSKPSHAVFLVTILGVVLFTVFTVTPVGGYLGLTALPVGYYGFLILDVLCYLIAISGAKHFYFRKHRELL
ncbi:MAG: magnesium-translocating P-type ATPase [Clostridiales bacterium]|nr:magnesium-translocating P-type ATPase [Clostridiales bacterium]